MVDPRGLSSGELTLLAERARDENTAWHSLVRELRHDVDLELSRHGLDDLQVEAAQQATWRSLAMRLHLGAPLDVRSWLTWRAAHEANQRRADVSAHAVARPWLCRHHLLVEHSQVQERRTVSRPGVDRRHAHITSRSPDVLAAEIVRQRAVAR